MSQLLPPGSTLGMLGSGQLGRMTGQAARQLGYRLIILSPEADSPAGHVADKSVVAPLEDTQAYVEIAKQCDVLTYEFENVPSELVASALPYCPVFPDPGILHLAQHRLREKNTLQALGIPTADFAAIASLEALSEALANYGTGVLKRVTGGYDGKGQAVVRHGSEWAPTYTELSHNGRDELILERLVSFRREVSVIVARNPAGDTVAFPCAENVHRNGILHLSLAPARVEPDIALAAERLACRIANGLGLIGVMGVELFDTETGLVVNELAPRPHNSGHYTLDACNTSQFEQHVRAVMGLPLGSPAQHTPAVMLNLLGEHIAPLYAHLEAILSDPMLKLHLYGKAEAREGRKMGHITALGPTLDDCLQRLDPVWRRLDPARTRLL